MKQTLVIVAIALFLQALPVFQPLNFYLTSVSRIYFLYFTLGIDGTGAW